MKKRMLSLLLVLVMVLGMLPAGVFAADVTEISDQSGLAAMSNGSYKLTADVDLDSTWSPISSFSGTLDGNGHTITLSGTPLINTIDTGAVIKNLVLEGTVTSENSVGSLAILCRGATVRNCLSYANVSYTGTGGSGYFVHYAAGLVGSMSSNSALIENCVYAGTLSTGSAPVYGSVANNQFYVYGTISKCIGVGSDRIGSAEGFDSHSAIDVGTNTVIADASGFDPSSYVVNLNTNRDATSGDLEWFYSQETGKMGITPAAADPDATADEIAALKTAITTAEGSCDSAKLYTKDSYSTYTAALANAKTLVAEIDGGAAKSGRVVTAATTTLSSAVLTERTVEAVTLPETGVIEITNANYATYFENANSLKAGNYYRLAEDITVSGYYFGSYETMNCVLDGNGHTITLTTNNPLWSAIGESGVVQNVGILGSITKTGYDLGTLAASCSGLIVNCYSQANVTGKNSGGIVANLKSGGAIVNCYATGAVSGTGSVGPIAGTAEANTLIQNCYWQSGTSAAGAASGITSGCAVKTAAEMKQTAFVTLLNENKGGGKTWTQSSSGYPHLGQAQTYVPETPVKLTFTSHDGDVTTFMSDEGISLDYGDVEKDDTSAFAGTFSCEGAADWVNLNSDSTNQILWVYANGRLDLNTSERYGTVNILVNGANGAITQFPVTIREPGDVYAMRLLVDGEVVTDTLEVEGSENVAITVQVQREENGTWGTLPSGVAAFESNGNVKVSNGVLNATAPGNATGTVTVSALGKSVTLTVDSTYVAVTSIKPAASGTYTVHGRNANSDSSGDFLDLMLSHGVGTVIVDPGNASYQSDWTITSSDKSVAEYVSSMLLAVLPKKAGTTTLTATLIDKGADGTGNTEVTGSTEVTIKYFNPVASVAVDTSSAITVKTNEETSLPITFTGPESADGYHVTEPGMVWSYSGDGEIEIVRDGDLGVIVGEEGSEEYCVANDKYLIKGIKEGMVTVTGTPVDTTGNAQPVTFTVTVTEGEAEQPADIDKLVADGISGAQNYLNANAPETYAYGYEWEIFSLVRSGAAVPQSKLDAYLDSVEETYTNSPDSEALQPTTLARVALTLGVLGQDASNFRGLDFVEMLYSSNSIESTSNMPMWALIALDSRNYEIPEDAKWDRDALIDEILTYQNENGGFGLGDNTSVDVDMTGMALQALAPYYASNEEVKAAVDKALTWLKGQMSSEVTFKSSAESTAQVLTALTALNLDPVDADNGFVKSAARNIISGLASFQEAGGGFKYGDRVNKMATIQSLYALTSYDRFDNGKIRLYDLTDVEVTAETKLANRIEEVENLSEADYTAETWEALQTALAAAKSVAEKTDATEAEITAADKALADAIAALEAINDGGDDGANGTVDVYVTIAYEGSAVVAQEEVEVSDVNENGIFDVDDTLYAIHENAYEGGAAAGYATAVGSWGLSITKLWGDTSGSYGYWLNDASCWSLEDEVAEGDYVVAFVYADKTGYSDAYTKFDKSAYTAIEDKALTVKLEKAGYDASWNTVFSALPGAAITAYGADGKALAAADYTVVDNGDGTYSVTFTNPGTYRLIAGNAASVQRAASETPIIVPAVCTVEVMDTISVDVTISNAGSVVMAQETVTVYDVNGNGFHDVDDTLYAAHEAAYEGGAAAGYGSANGAWGLGITKLWGDTSGFYGYWLNDASCWSLEDKVAEGDYLVAFVYKDKTTWSDAYAKFEKSAYTATEDKALTVKLEKAGYDASWNTVFSALPGAAITAYGADGKALAAADYTVADNGDGTYSITFAQDGTYQLVATEDTPIVPAVTTVTVNPAESGTAPGGSTSEGTTPEGTTPEGTTPEGTTPEGTTPEGTTPEGTTPEGTTPEVTTPESTAPESTKPVASTPATGDESNVVVYATIMLISLAALAVLLVLGKKRSFNGKYCK